MKKQALMVLMTLSLFVSLVAVSARAQSNMHLKFNIPFEFSVRNKILPAGEYRVKYVAQTALMIQSADSTTSQIFLVNSTTLGTRRNEASLIFNQYGDRYFLCTIWTGGGDSLDLMKTAAEWELIGERRALAKTSSAGQIVRVPTQR